MPSSENAVLAMIRKLKEKLKDETNPAEIERLKSEIEHLLKTLQG